MSKLLLYCDKKKPYLTRNDLPNEKGEFYKHWQLGGELDKKHLYGDTPILNGKIVAECDFEVEEIGLVEIPDYAGDECHTFVYDVSIYFETKTLNQDKLFKKSCLNWEEMEKYLYSTNGKGYAISVKNLHMFDKPKELSDYYTRITDKDRLNDFKGIDVIFPSVMIYELLYETVSCKKLEKAPKNMQKIVVFNKETNKYEYKIIIPVSPQEMCRIANKEQTILVRRNVLKEVL